MLSLGPIAVAATALLLAPAVQAGSVSPFLADRFSISGTPPPPTAPPPFTLLDPTWLLPVESLETAAAVADGAERAGAILRDDAAARAAPQDSSHSSGGPLSYSLSDDLTAQFHYHHAELLERGDSQSVRDDESTAFSTRPDRDVLDLNMSWRLAGSTLGLGYQLQSARGGSGPGEVGFSRFLPGSQQATHALTLGLTREWGAAAAPSVLIEPPLLPPGLDVADAGATPTPAL